MPRMRELGFEDYISVLQRHWLPILLLGSTMAAAGFGVSRVVPKRYMSRTTVLVDEPRVPDNYVHPVMTEDLSQRLATMQEQILSRTQLDAIIERFNLFPKLRGKVPKEDLIARMRTAVVVDQIHTDTKTSGVPGFSIHFTGDDPRVAQAVCAEITSMFMRENLRARQQRATNTTEFLESQVNEAKRALEAQDQKLAQFKEQYIGQLPDQEQTNMNLLAGYTAQLEATNQALSRAEQDKSYTESLLAQQLAALTVTSTGSDPEKDQQQLADMRAQLAALRVRYTESHPDVVKLETQIRELSQWVGRSKTATGNSAAASMAPVESPELQRLRNQVHALESLVTEKTAQQRHLQREIRTYQERVQLSPIVEQQYKDLTRDYQTALAFYNDLLAKKSQSAMATDLERSQQGEQFRILDPADLPEKPVFPNPVIFTVAGLLAGLVMGTAIALLRAALDTRIRTEADVQRAIRLSVIGSIPLITAVPALPGRHVTLIESNGA